MTKGQEKVPALRSDSTFIIYETPRPRLAA